jgi:hypothetical protein
LREFHVWAWTHLDQLEEKALGYLRKAVDNGMPHAIAEHMGQDPDLKALRGDPEFETLTARARQAASSK